MKKLFLVIAILLLAISSYSQTLGPRNWSAWGTAAVGNAQVTVGGASPFLPISVCVTNLDATNNIAIDWTDGVAAYTSNATNQRVAAGKTACFKFRNQNPIGTMVIGIISDAGTPAYVFNAVGIS
jgi:hypothetical protein